MTKRFGASSLRGMGVVALLAGIGTMALEMAASRLFAPHVGQSALVWASLIGIVLVQLTAGYRLGGALAERWPAARLLGGLLGGAALAVVAVAFAGPELLRALVDPIVTADTGGLVQAIGPEVIGTVVGSIVLLTVPIMLLSTVPPFTIRLAIAERETSGRVAGSLYALSTAGSIIGTFGAALVMIPWVGVRATLLVLAVVLVVAATWCLIAVRAVGASTADAATDTTTYRPATSTDNPVMSIGAAATFAGIAGFATMAGELAVARLAAPFFGASTVVWATLIGLVLIYLAFGSYIGGHAADRWPTIRALAITGVLAAVCTAALPFIASPLMRGATAGIEDAAISSVIRAFVSLLVVLAPSMLLLGMLPPWAIRLAVGEARGSGRTAGHIYAAGTLGSLVGTFATALLLVPAIGTRRTLEFVAAGLLIAAILIAPRWRLRLVFTVVLAAVVVLAVLPVGNIKPRTDRTVLFEGESRYQFVQVVRDPDDRVLLQLNEGWAIHSIYDPKTVLAPNIWNHYLPIPALLDPDHKPVRGDTMHALMLGSAAGTTPRAWAAIWPNMKIDGVELDPLVTKVGRRYFHEGEIPTLTVHQGDARPWLAASHKRWDLIHIDAYRQPYIPFYLATREFFEETKSHLGPHGVLSINVGSAPGHAAINRAIAATMRSQFPFVVRYRPAGEYNELIVAWVDPTMTRERARMQLLENPLALPADEAASEPTRSATPAQRLPDRYDDRTLREVFAGFADGMRVSKPHPDKVMTDDHAPVEWMTDLMIARAAEEQ